MSSKKLLAGFIVSTVLWGLSSLTLLQICLAFFVVFIITPAERPKLPIHFGGYVEHGFEKVEKVFRENLKTKGELGGAYSVYYKGKAVVDLWGGYADIDAKLEWREDTVSTFQSTTKGVTAITVAYMVERGLLDYENPVAYYWPEFAQNGKDKITLKTLLSHQAGLLIIDEKFRLNLMLEDPEELGRILAIQKPNWEPGTGHGYHLITLALYVDQIIRRVDPLKRDLGTYFQEEIAKPFGIDFHIGLPFSENYRCADTKPSDFGLLHTLTVVLPVYAKVTYLVLKDYIYGDRLMLRACGNPTDMEGRKKDPYFRCLPCGSSHGYGTARSLAKLFGILANGGITTTGERLISKSAIDKLNTPLSSGIDKFLLIELIWGYGMGLAKVGGEDDLKGNKPERYIFGHGGTGGQMAFADPHYNLGFSYLTNYMNMIHGMGMLDHRYEALQDATYECVHEIEKNL